MRLLNTSLLPIVEKKKKKKSKPRDYHQLQFSLPPPSCVNERMVRETYRDIETLRERKSGMYIEAALNERSS